MGESAEFEKLTVLEARLATALDRIATGVAANLPAAAATTGGPLQEAEARAEVAEERLAEARSRVEHLEARLGEARNAPAPAADATDIAALAEERDALARKAATLEAAHAADRDEWNRARAARQAEIDDLRAKVEAAADEGGAAPADAAGGDETAVLREGLDLARYRVKRLREQRRTARAERDEARDLIEEMKARSDLEPDARVAALRSELARLRAAQDDLMETVDGLRAAKAPDAALMDESLIDEIGALKALRASEAAELERILAELEPALAQGGAHARD